MSVVVWAMVGIAFWHFAVLVPDRFWGGIVGAFMAAISGGLLCGARRDKADRIVRP
jgi:multidrug efflux pump subunit AcrB